MTNDAVFTFAKPQNEPVHSYQPGSKERHEVKQKLAEFSGKTIEIPLIIGGKEVKTSSQGIGRAHV